jgi:acetolactate synthase-1/2/3 large subunit
VLVLSGTSPTAQENRGGLQDIDHTAMVSSITRYARTVRHPALVLQELNEAVSRAMGHGADSGPCSTLIFLSTPCEVQCQQRCNCPNFLSNKLAPVSSPGAHDVAARSQICSGKAKRPSVYFGSRCQTRPVPHCEELLTLTGGVYVWTQARAKALFPRITPAWSQAMRGQVMGQADLVITVGRKLDFQLAYGSPAVFGQAQFLRLADNAAELRDNPTG